MQPIVRQAGGLRGLGYALHRLCAPGRRLRIDLPGQGLRFELPVASLFARHLYKYRAYEPGISNWLIRNASLLGDGLLVDIGANFGWYSCLLSRLLPSHTVLAYEPEPDNFALLERQLALNGAANVRAFLMGLGESAGMMRLYKYKASNSGRHSLLPLHGGDSLEVRVGTLDGHLEELALGDAPVELVKIDIEGYEVFALRGAHRTLQRTRRIVLEYSPELMTRAGIDQRSLLELLEAAGFAPGCFDASAPDGVRVTDYAALRGTGGQLDLLLTRAR